MQLGTVRPAPVAVIGLSRGPATVPPGEAALRALENAGVLPESLRDTAVGVFATARADVIAAELGTLGPVLTVDVQPAGVLHLACQSIQAEESDVALVGIVSPGGSGGFLLLKPLSAAVADGDPIYCVIDGSALGRGDVLRRACDRAEVERTGIQFLWRRGYHCDDAMLDNLFDSEEPVGENSTGADSVGRGLAGEDEAAALLEMPVLLRRRRVPVVGVPLDLDSRLTAVFSSTDGAGTACALVLSEPPTRPLPSTRTALPTLPLVLSADSAETLRGKAETLRAHLAEPGCPDLLDTAYTLAVAREHRPHRAVVLAGDQAELAEGLTELAAGRGGAAQAGTRRTVAFLFPGEGGQRPGMGRELYPRFEVFADALDEVCDQLAAVSTWAVRDLLLGDGCADVAPADEALYSQDALFALQLALFRQFEDWGVRPDYVVGHSVGELAAATAAGVFSLPDVCALLAERIRLFREKTPVGGAMVAMRVSEAEALESLAGLEHLAGISAVNAPNSVVISGDRDTVSRIAGQWSDRGRKVKRLPVDRAFHSPHMAAMAEDLGRFVRGLSPLPPRIPVVAVHNSLGSDPGVVCLPEYWSAQVAGTGNFLNCVRSLDSVGVDTYVDLSANGVLAALVEETLAEPAAGKALVTAALRGEVSDLRAVLDTLGELHTHGVGVDWPSVFRGWGGRRTHLPTEVAQPATAVSRVTDLPRVIRTETEAMIDGGYGPDRSFFELGLDSVAAVELVNRLRKRTGLKIPTVALFDHPTPNLLAAHLDRHAHSSTVAVPRRNGSDEPIAIVGMSCRFPGGVSSPEDLWRLVESGGEAITSMPEDRGWDLAALYDPDRERQGTSYVREGGFLHDAAEFDPAFFGIGGHEAVEMDPQQRLLLELTWEAFERAGIDPAALRGSDTGVYAGLTHGDYGTGGPGFAGLTTRSHLMIGTASSVASGRISFVFGLQGPNVAIDTACSSSLVGLHLAAAALRGGECSLALAGAATVMASPMVFVEFSRQGGLASDARAKPFAESADGTAWSEGGGMFVLERYSDARRNGHPVLALLVGSAVNSDGASNGLTAPNGAAQHRLLVSAVADARLRPSDVDVVEAHGTGTKLGDPIEAGALQAAYGRDRPPNRPLLVGSVKSNLGHTQAAAGAAGVIKMVQAMRHGLVPATLNVDRPSPHVDWDAGLRLVTERTPWPDQGPLRRAGVSSFGIGGTNAHVILQQAPTEPETPAAPTRSIRPLWTVSGGSVEALRAQAGRLAAHWAAHPELDEGDIGFSLATTRTALPHRAVLIGGEPDLLRRSLTALAAGGTDPDLTVGAVVDGGLAFLLTGQGSQRVGMGRELYATYPAFAEAFDEVCAGFDLPVRETVFGTDQQALDRTEFAQTGLFAFQVALFRLLESWGIRPDLLLGHSVGELTAAHLAGVLSLGDACTLVAARGSLMQALPAEGAMYAVAASAEEVAPLPPGVSLAAVNGPRSVVLSGTEEAVAELADRLRVKGRRTKRLRVSHAFHSALMDPMLDEFRTVAEKLSYRAPEIPVVSDLTGRQATAEELGDPEYWVRHVRGTVRFADGMRALAEEHVTTFLELGPETTLTEMAADCLSDTVDTAVIPVLRREDVLGAVAALHVRGHGPDWSAWYAGSGARPVELPTYAFQRKRFWLLPDPVEDSSAQPDSAFWAAVASEDLQRLTELLGTGADATLGELLPAMARWRRDNDRDAGMDRLRYRIGWRPVADQVAIPRNWLIVHAADLPVPQPLAEVLGAATMPVGIGWGRAEIAERLSSTRDGERIDGVLSLLAWDERPCPSATEIPAGLASSTALVQAMGDIELDVPLWCATSGAVSTGHDDRLASPTQAMVWGLGRVAALEHPQRWGGLVDLPATLDATAAGRLAGVLSSTEDQVAVRASGAFVRRLLPAPVGGGARRDWPLRGTTLITGAFGALGRRVARWLAAWGAERLLLIGRHASDPELVAELTALGAEVDVAACDVADRAAMAELLARIPEDRPLSAVVHTAGVLEDGVIDALDPQRLARVLHAKVAGARNLHELTGELTAFVLFSSATGAIGNAGQANYAAANTYLDALAEQRRADGLAATSLAWGPWGAGGMAVDGADAELVGARLRRNGMTVLDPDQAIGALHLAFARDESGLVIADVDWARFLTVFATTRVSPMLAELPEARQHTAAEPRTEVSALVDRLAELSQAERVRALRELVCRHTAQILGHDSVTQVRPGKPFYEQGLSSLGVVELRNQLSARTGLRVPASALFDHPTPTALAGYLDAELAPVLGTARPEPPAAEFVAEDVHPEDLDAMLSRAEQELSLAAKDHIDG